MILGIGTDICDSRRIKALYEGFGQRFLDRLFSVEEQAYCLSKPQPALSMAKRFAAKEAASKALGTGVRGFFYTDIWVDNDKLGRPVLCLKDAALNQAHKLAGEGRECHFHLSLSDEDPYATAFVVIEGR